MLREFTNYHKEDIFAMGRHKAFDEIHRRCCDWKEVEKFAGSNFSNFIIIHDIDCTPSCH